MMTPVGSAFLFDLEDWSCQNPKPEEIQSLTRCAVSEQRSVFIEVVEPNPNR